MTDYNFACQVRSIIRHYHKERLYFAFREFIQRLHRDLHRINLHKTQELSEGSGIQEDRAGQASLQQQSHTREPEAAQWLPTQLPSTSAKEPEAACGKISLTLSIWVL